jgi:hypothetical protein
VSAPRLPFCADYCRQRSQAHLATRFGHLCIRYIRIIPRAPGDLRSIGNAADFSMDFSVDPSLRDLAKKMLPLAVYYSNVSHFTDGKNLFGDGLVRQAVAAGMRALLKECVSWSIGLCVCVCVCVCVRVRVRVCYCYTRILFPLSLSTRVLPFYVCVCV